MVGIMPFEKLPGLMQLAVMEKRGEITASQFVEFAAKRRNATAGKSDDDPSSKSKTCRVGGKVYKIAKTRNGKALTCGGKTRAQLKGEKNAADVQKLRDAGGEFEGKIAGKPYKVNADMLEVANKMGVSSRMLAAGRVPSEVQTDLRRKFNQMTIGDTVTKPKAEPKPKPEKPRTPQSKWPWRTPEMTGLLREQEKYSAIASMASSIAWKGVDPLIEKNKQGGWQVKDDITTADGEIVIEKERFGSFTKRQAANVIERETNDELARRESLIESIPPRVLASDRLVRDLESGRIQPEELIADLESRKNRLLSIFTPEIQDDIYRGKADLDALLDQRAKQYEGVDVYQSDLRDIEAYQIRREIAEIISPGVAQRKAKESKDQSERDNAEQARKEAETKAKEAEAKTQGERLEAQRIEVEALLNQTVKQTPLTPEQRAKLEADAARYEASPESKLARAQREKEEAVAKQRRDEQRAEAKEYQRTQLGLFDPTPPTPDEIKRANAESFPARDATWNAAAQQVARETPNAKGFTPTQRAYAIAQAQKQLSDLAGVPIPIIPTNKAVINGLTQIMGPKNLRTGRVPQSMVSALEKAGILTPGVKGELTEYGTQLRDFYARLIPDSTQSEGRVFFDIPNPVGSSRYDMPPIAALQFLGDIGVTGKENSPIEFEENGAMWFEFAEYELDPGVMALMNDPNLSAMYEILAEIAPELVAIREYPAETNA